MSKLKRIKIGKLEISRLIAGTNQISGYSHYTREKDREMIDYFTADRVFEYFDSCLYNDIDTVVARADAFITRMIEEYRKRKNSRLIWIAQTAKEYYNLFENIKFAYKNNCDAVYIHGGTVDTYFEKGLESELVEVIKTVKKELPIPIGIAAHNAVNHLKLIELSTEIDFHLICMYQISGYQGRRDDSVFSEKFEKLDRQIALDVLKKIERPCILYKIFAAGRLTASEAFSDIRKAIKDKDGVLIGMYPKDNPNVFRENSLLVNGL